MKLDEESKIEKVKLFKDSNLKLVRIGKNLHDDFKQKLIELLKKYHEFLHRPQQTCQGLIQRLLIINWPLALTLSQ